MTTETRPDPATTAKLALDAHMAPAAHPAPAPAPFTGRAQVAVTTDLGDFALEVFGDKAPITAANFLAYVRGGHLDGQSVFRIVTLTNDLPTVPVNIEALHWGWLPSPGDAVQPYPNIPLETTGQTGLTHKRGALSMARYGEGISGPSYSIVMGDAPEMDEGGTRNRDGRGVAVFGEVLWGWETLQAIFARAEAQTWLRDRIAILRAEVLDPE